MSIIEDRIGWRKVPLPIDHNHYNLRRKQIHLHLLEKISSVEALFSEVGGYCYGYCNQLCDWGFAGVDLMWLAALTVRLQVSNWLSDTVDCPIALSDYNSKDKLVIK